MPTTQGTGVIHYLGPSVGKIPLSTWDQVKVAAEGGLLEETPWVELKERLTPGKCGNRELAKDLAALSVYGGVLVIGVRDKTFEVVGCDVSGYDTRISQVAATAIHPPLTPVIYPAIANPEDGTKSVLVVEVPASSVAPHMANDKYWGRSSEGTRPLSDPEVRALISARDATDATFRARLLAMPSNDPVNDRVLNAPTGNGHIFLLAEPCAPVFSRDLDADLVPVVWNEVGGAANKKVLASLRERIRDPRGVGLAYPAAADPVVERRHEHSVAHLLIFDDDNSIEFASGGGTRSPEGMEVVANDIVVTAVREFLQLIQVLSQKHWAYTGEWRVGLHINGLKGKPISFNDFTRRNMTFTTETVTAQLVTSPAAWDDGIDPVARQLMAGFLRAIGCEKWELDHVIGL